MQRERQSRFSFATTLKLSVMHNTESNAANNSSPTHETGVNKVLSSQQGVDNAEYIVYSFLNGLYEADATGILIRMLAKYVVSNPSQSDTHPVVVCNFVSELIQLHGQLTHLVEAEKASKWKEADLYKEEDSISNSIFVTLESSILTAYEITRNAQLTESEKLSIDTLHKTALQSLSQLKHFI